MKKQFLFAAAILISAISFAQLRSPEGRSTQVISKAKPTFGIRAGILSSGIRGEASNNLDDLLNFSNGMITTNSHTGFYAGGYASIPVGAGISLEPGAFYSQKGYEMTGSIESKTLGFLGAGAKAKLQSEYIDIPILLKANLGSGLQIFAGPQFSYLIKANLNTTAGLLGIDLLNNDMDVTKQFNQWDAAITGGIGYKLSNGININASYDYGLSKIDKNQNSKAYNYAIKLGVGIEF
ncbi:MAG TPA: porin family protein [Chitinophagaceae bacterium]|nr:porin family protein [Chitinophagaceae bacterium]